MGSLLWNPRLGKDLMAGKGEDGRFAFGIAAMQGRRPEMEDTHLALPDFDADRNLALFGVFDGHGGIAVAEVAAARLPETLRGLEAYRKGQYCTALQQAYLGIDCYLDSSAGREEVKQRSQPSAARGGMGRYSWQPESIGCTAVVALIHLEPDGTCGLYVANAGDSRCVLTSGDKAVGMSCDHKPTNDGEWQRIRSAHGVVTSDGRVDGNLNVSRALGDLFYKKDRRLKPEEQKISAMPDVKYHCLNRSDRYLILASDGIWEKATNQTVASFLLNSLDQRRRQRARAGVARAGDEAGVVRMKAMMLACASFLDWNVSENPSKTERPGRDNMTLMMVDLQSLRRAAAAAPEVKPAARPAKRTRTRSGRRCSAGARRKWDAEDSAPDEPCPDKEKHGTCSYGRQCGFCHR